MHDVNQTIRMFAEQYCEKLFYFSLKKTGNQTEAEDLASEIALDIILALRKGIIPEYFSAYVWKCARNRYAKWVEKRTKSRENSADIDENLISEEYNLEEDFILHQDLKALRRELALISKDYREILVSFYIDDKKVKQIATQFNLPEGTVKRKLFESRKKLSEGMKMAREFGVKSYKPSEVQLWTSGIGKDGHGPGPRIHYNKRLVKNILLEAYGNPSTVEELSLELGVAAPYMEDEVKILVENDLLEKLNGDRYETAFPIISAETQRQLEHISLKAKYEHYKVMREVWDGFFKTQKENIMFGVCQTQSFEELKWVYIILMNFAIDKRLGTEQGKKDKRPLEEIYPKKSKGGHWDMMGLEQYPVHEEFFGFASHNGQSAITNSDYDLNFPTLCFYGLHQFQKDTKDIWRYFSSEQVGVLWDMYNGVADYEKDKETIKFILDKGAFEVKDGKYIPKFITTYTYPNSHDSDTAVHDYVTNMDESLWNKVRSLGTKLKEESRAIIMKDVPEKFHDNSMVFGSLTAADTSSSVMFAAIEDGYLQVPEDISKSMIGAFLMIPKKEEEK